MPHIVCDEFTVGSENLVEFNIFDGRETPPVEVIDASIVDLTMFDATDTEIGGVSWALSMLPYDSGREKYLVVVPDTAVVSKGDRIRAEVVVVAPAGRAKFHLRNIPVVEHVPET